MAVSSKYGTVLVEIEPGNPLNNTDEPVFVLRARDKVALQCLFMYKQGALAAGAGPEIERGMAREFTRFNEWRQAHPELVKVPD
jgi:hypothetical protein